MEKSYKKINPKDPVLGNSPQEKGATEENTKKIKSFIEKKKILGKNLDKDEKPFKGYNPKKHARTGGLNEKERERINREEGRNLKRPVTGKPKPGSKDAKRRKSFCARMSGVKGPTSKEGKLTPKGAALKRWNCSKSEEMHKTETEGNEMISVPHILFSMDNPAHGEHNPHNYSAILHVLKNMGADAHEVQGNYGHTPERSILVRNPTEEVSATIHHLAGKSGQESVLHSDGQNHELHFLNGPMMGNHVKGSGTTYHTTAPETNFSVLPDGTIFSHNLDFDQEHPNEQ